MFNFDPAHWFWWLTTAAVLIWYSTITVYVAIKGAFDVKHMLARLKEENAAETGGATPSQ